MSFCVLINTSDLGFDNSSQAFNTVYAGVIGINLVFWPINVSVNSYQIMGPNGVDEMVALFEQKQ